MAFLEVNNVAIRGISACVPKNIEENAEIPFYTSEEAAQVIKSTGIERKHIVPPGMTNTDLCEKAFLVLIEKLGWLIESIDAIVYVTQTEDYITPPNAFVMHDRLNLSQECLAFDINHGCPGWVVGLSTITSLMTSGHIRRAILFDGDNCTTVNYKFDRESRPLFGDCGTCTALEYDEYASPMQFHIGTNSKDGISLLRKNGGSRYPYSLEMYKTELGKLSGEIEISNENANMDGASVFSFGISTVPKGIKSFCQHYNIDIAEIDKIVLHQANKFMLDKIAKKLKASSEQVPTSLRNYGNTTSASIPLTIVSECASEYSTRKMNTLGCGFGTGLSWASFHVITDKIICPDVIEL